MREEGSIEDTGYEVLRISEWLQDKWVGSACEVQDVGGGQGIWIGVRGRNQK